MLNRFIIVFLSFILFSCSGSKLVTGSKKNHIEFSYNLVVHDVKDMKVDGKIIIDNDFTYCQGYSKTMGVELFRLKSTYDSIFFIDKYNKTYYTGIKNVQNINNETFAIISNIDIILKSWYIFSKNDKSVLAYSKDVVSYNTSKIDENNILDIDLINGKISIVYSNVNEKYDFPETIILTIVRDSRIMKVSFNIDEFLKYNSINPDLRIPKKYKPLV